MGVVSSEINMLPLHKRALVLMTHQTPPKHEYYPTLSDRNVSHRKLANASASSTKISLAYFKSF
jgi:hypothetical protein